LTSQKLFEEPEPKALKAKLESEVEESESEVEESLMETPVDLPVESIINLVLSLTAISLKSPDIYDQLHIFLQETES